MKSPRDSPDLNGPEPGFRIVQPCTVSCPALRPLRADRWLEFGRCTNPRSPFCGFPVRVGRDCPDFLRPDDPGFSSAN